MKKIILTLSLALSLLSCSTESESLSVNTEATSNNAVVSKIASKKTESVATIIPNSSYDLTSYNGCAIDCISKNSTTYFEKTAQQTISWGGGKFSKTIYIKYFNTQTEFVLQVLSTEKFSNLIINGDGKEIRADENTWATYKYPLKDGWKACDTESFRLQVAGDGPQGDFDVNYSLVGICPEIISCENAFSGKTISCGTSREAEYTFTSKENISNLKIQGGLTNFAGSAVVTITGGSLTATQKTPGGSSNRVITVEGSISACETIKINIKWNSSNSGDTITGEWSASGSGVTVDNILGLTCN